MDERLDALASNIVIINPSAVKPNTRSATAISQKDKRSLLIKTIEPGHTEEPKYDGDSQGEPFSETVPNLSISSEAMLAAKIPCPESPLQINSEEFVTIRGAGNPMDREILCAEGSRETNEKYHLLKESTSPQEPMPGFEADMQGLMGPLQVVVDEQAKTIANEGSQSEGVENAQTVGNILNGTCSDLDLLNRRSHVAHSTVNSGGIGNHKLWSLDDPSVIDEKRTTGLNDDKQQNKDQKPAKANAIRLVIVKLPSVIPKIFGTVTENPLNAEPEVVASLDIESSSVANAESWSVGITDERSLDMSSAAAPHSQESRSRTSAKMEIQSAASQDVTESAVAPQGLQTIRTDSVELQIVKSRDLTCPAAAQPDPESRTFTAPDLKTHTVDLHDLTDVAGATRVAVDNISSSNEKAGKDSKAGQPVEPASRVQEFLFSEEKRKPGLRTSSSSKAGDIPESSAVSTTSKDEKATAKIVPMSAKKHQHYRKYAEREKYDRKMAAEQAALDISNRTFTPEPHREPTNESHTAKDTAKDNDNGSNGGEVVPRTRVSSALDTSNRTSAPQDHQESKKKSRAAKDDDKSSNAGCFRRHIREFPARARRFQEVHQILLKNSYVAESNIGRPVDKESDCKALETSRNDEIGEVDGVMKRTKAPDDTTNVSPPSDMATITRGVGGRHGPVKGRNNILKDKDRNSREQRAERLEGGLQSQCDQRPAPDYETHTETRVKSEDVRAGVDGRAGQASEKIQHGIEGRSVLPMSERSTVSVDKGELVEKGMVRKKRKWKVRRVIAGIDNRNQGPEDRAYANHSLHPPLRPESTISSGLQPALNEDDGDQYHMNDLSNDVLNSFIHYRRLPEVKMSVDGPGRTARVPRGRNPGRGGLNHQNQNQNHHHHNNQTSVHDQNIDEFKVEPMHTGRRHHPGFQPQPRESDSHRLMNGLIGSPRRTAKNQPFQSQSTSLDNGLGTMTNHSDSITKPNSPRGSGTTMATFTPKPGRKDVDNTPRVQTSTHDAKWSQSQNNSTEIITHTDDHAHANININANVDADISITANGHAKVDGDMTSRIDYAHQDRSNQSGMTTSPVTILKNNTIDTHTHNIDHHAGVPLPAATPTNYTNNTNLSTNGRFRETGSGSGSVRKSRRLATTSTAPAPISPQDLPTIVPDGSWDASTIPSNANASESLSLDYRIKFKNLPKFRFHEAGRQTAQLEALVFKPPRNGSTAQAVGNPRINTSKAPRGSNIPTTATNPSPPAHNVPAQHKPAQLALAQTAPAEPAPADPAPAEPALAEPAPAQNAPVQQAPAQHVPAQQAPALHMQAEHVPGQDLPAEHAHAKQTTVTEASVVPSASSDLPDRVQKPKTLAKDGGVWLPPHLRTPKPAIPIQPLPKVILSARAKSAGANRTTRANTNSNSLEANSSVCANANGPSVKTNQLQTSATANAPINADVSMAKNIPTEENTRALSSANVFIAKHEPMEGKLSALSNADVSAARDDLTEANPSALPNADVSAPKEKPAEANPSALLSADPSAARDQPTEVNPRALSNANEDGTKCEPIESNPSAVVEVIASARVELVEPSPTGLVHPDVSNIPALVQQLSKGKQPELAAAHIVPTPPASYSNRTVNSQASVAERRAIQKETLEFEHPLAGWDGNWGPAPVEWGGRPSFDHSDTWHVKSMHDWLQERTREALHNPLVMNTTDPGFKTGAALAAGDIVLASPIDNKFHETHLPDDEFTKVKFIETAADAVKKHESKIKVEIQETKAERRAFRQAMRDAQASYALLPNPHAPEANIFIRPAEAKDLKQISEIYNHYIEHSVVVAELEKLTEHQWRGRWIDATESNYAFLVAVQLSTKGGGYNRRTSQETICGFAYADDFGDVRNAWRYTCELQCYVGNWTLRKGVGKSLIDRMLGALDPIYVVRAGARFEGGTEPIRYEGGGVRVVHKVVINIPYAAKDETTLKWQKEWLAQFQFEHVGTLPGIGRKFDKVVNLAMLMMETGSVLPGGRL